MITATAPPRSHHVAVIGGGPAGLACAIALAQSGASISLVARRFAYADKETWRKIQRNGMAVDNSWENAARNYVELYNWTRV